MLYFFKVWQIHIKGEKLTRTAQSMVNLVLRSDQEKSRLSDAVVPKYLSKISWSKLTFNLCSNASAFQ